MNKKTVLAALCAVLAIALAAALLLTKKNEETAVPENANKAVTAVDNTGFVAAAKAKEEVREKSGGSIDIADITNILLIGVDNCNLSEMDSGGNSDGVMIVSLNTVTREIVLTSFMRDTRIREKDQVYTKLTYAYHDGGVPMLKRAIEENFEIPIDHYVLVDYIDLVNIVDAIGGTDFELTKDEIYFMQGKIGNINTLTGAEYGSNSISVDDAGMLHLNGVQTVAYSRIRPASIGYDRGRTEIAREIVKQIFANVSAMSTNELMDFYGVCMDNLETDMTDSELMTIRTNAKEFLEFGCVSDRAPADDECTTRNDGSGYYVIPDLEKMNQRLYESIYEGKH